MRRDDYPDFYRIEPKFMGIHLRLENWGRWANGKPSVQVQPMFVLYRSDEHREGLNPSIPIDSLDAAEIQKTMPHIPENNRHALKWYYVMKCTPGRAARALGVNTRGLDDLVRQARIMVMNRAKGVDSRKNAVITTLTVRSVYA